MKNVIIAAVIGESAAGLIGGITSYYSNQQTASNPHNAPVVFRLMSCQGPGLRPRKGGKMIDRA